MRSSIEELDNKEGHDRLIGGFGRFFAAHAWEGHMYSGPGAVVIIMSQVQDLGGNPRLYGASLKYAPAGSELLTSLGLWPHEGMERILKEYNPESEVVCIVVSLNRVAHCYGWTVPENLAPPKAYKEWREKHPIGMRIAPGISLEEALRLLIAYEMRKKRDLRAEGRRIRSDVGYAASFLNTLIETQKEIRAELESGGLGIGPDGETHLIEPTSPPKNSFEILNFNAKTIDYLATTTAINQALKAYETSNGNTDDRLKEVALVAHNALYDLMTRLLVAYSSSDFSVDLAEDSEETQKIFLIFAAARLRVNLRQFPRIRAALRAEAKAEGQPVNKIILQKILNGIWVVWEEYKRLPHSPLINDSNILYNALARFIEHDTPTDELKKYAGDIVSDSEPIDHPTPYITDFVRELETADNLALWLRQAGLSTAEQEVAELKLQDLTEQEIAQERGCQPGTVKALWFRAKQKLQQARRP